MMNIRLLLAIALMHLSSMVSAEGGIGLSTTRVVYPSDAKVKQITVMNTDKDHEFLLQSWIEDGQGKVSRNIAVVPPLVLIKPGSENVIRLINTDKTPPTDRESLYWLSVKAIPEKAKDGAESSLQFAIVNRIKVFYRPVALQKNAAEAYKLLEFSLRNGKLLANNPTPYFITLTNIKVDGSPINAIMLPPKQSIEVMAMGRAQSIEADSINDFGGFDHFVNSVK